MGKYLAIVMLALCSVSSHADDEKKPVPLDPAYMGVHGMTLVSSGFIVFASLIPEYHKPHDLQLIYRLELKDSAITHIVRDADLVTIKPKPFNLQRLIRGEELTVKADVYLGHYAKDGVRTLSNMDITFSKQLYVRMLNDLEQPSTRQVYDTVHLRKKQRILVHQIQRPPSYDHLILLYDDFSCMTEFETRSAVPSQGELINKLTFCGSMKPLYYETEGFQ